MASGKPAFPGKTLAVIFKAILDETPTAPSQLKPEFPQGLEQSSSKHWRKTATCATSQRPTFAPT